MNVLTRGTVVIDTERCKGCELCIPACRPGVLTMSEVVNGQGARYPLLFAGCTACRACREVCPDFVFEVYRFDEPQMIDDGDGGRRRGGARGRGARLMALQLMQGADAITEAAINVGCRFFSGYPMLPFTPLLESFARQIPTVGGVCMNAASEIEAVNMALGAGAAGAGPGPAAAGRASP